MTEDILCITWNDGKGNAHISMARFFPCNERDFKKLMRLIRADWQHEGSILECIGRHFESSRDIQRANVKAYVALYGRHKQRAADIADMLENGKHVNGVPLAPKEIKGLKAELKDVQRSANRNLRIAKKAKKDAQWYEVHLKEVLDVF